MLEIKLLSLFVGSLGLQAMAVSGWLRWQQVSDDRQCEEEETLTPYESNNIQSETGSQPLNGGAHPAKDPRFSGWEFKIVRAERDLFRNPAIFKQLCEEEAQAGWTLLEKLDDRRVRFKRPLALRDISNPQLLTFDPYRTHYGSASTWTTLLWGGAFLVAILLPAYLGYALVSTTLSNLRSPEAPHPASSSPKPSPANSSPNVPPPNPPSPSPNPSPSTPL